MNSTYIRRPGPKSEAPQSAQEWDDLFARCLAGRKDELLEGIRNTLSGSLKVDAPPSAGAALDTWTSESRSHPPTPERRGGSFRPEPPLLARQVTANVDGD